MRARALALLCGLVALLVAGTARAETPSPAAVKAAFVYNFAKFVQWPSESFASSRSPLTLCLPRARENYNGTFTRIEGKSAQGRQLEVKHGVALKDLKGCHIVYLDDNDAARMRDILRTLGEAPVLTVGDIAGFAEAGGMIGFFAEDEVIRFEVNVVAASAGRLRISAQLLSLARIVRGPAIPREPR